MDISTPDLWNLNASVEAIAEAARRWREVETACACAGEVVDSAARDVVAEDSWSGATADSYDAHRRRLTGDIEDFSGYAADVAAALERLAWTIGGAQGRLTEALAALGVPHTREQGRIVFHADGAEAEAAVNAAITSANGIRAEVDEQLVLEEAVFTRTTSDVVEVKDAWREKTVRVVNLNIGSGNDRNTMGDKPGVGPEEVGDLGRFLAGQNPDIVTLQEVFESDLDSLREELERQTGDTWNVHYTEASRKARFGSPADVVGGIFDIPGVLTGDSETRYNESFGNAVLVREGESIAGSTTVDDHIQLHERGDDEGRSAIQVEVDYR